MNGTVSADQQIEKAANESKPKKKRIFYLDLIRAFAIVLVVLLHLCNKFIGAHDTGTIGWMIPTTIKGICIIAVPLFLLISGALLLNREYELKDYLSRRFVRLILPMVFWGVILIIANQYAGAPFMAHSSDIYKNIEWFLYDGYWFSWMLISVYLFIPIVNAFIREYGDKAVEYFLVIWLIYIVLFSFNLYPLYQFDLSYFAGYMGFLVLGYYLNTKEFKLSDRTLFIIGILIYIIFSAVNVYLRIVCLDKSELSGGAGLLVVLQTAGMFLFFKYFAMHSENNVKSISNKIYSFLKDTVIGKLIFSISICSYGIYLTHYLFLHIGCGWIQNNLFKIYSINPLKAMPLILVVVVLLSWILILLLGKIPPLRKWIGIG